MSAETFEVGEVAIVHDPLCAWHGHDCVILAGLMPRRFRMADGVHTKSCYIVRVHGAPWDSCSLPHELRKKRPPRDDLKVVRWSDVPWSPAKADA